MNDTKFEEHEILFQLSELQSTVLKLSESVDSIEKTLNVLLQILDVV